MNRKQEIALGWGSAAMALFHLFPPIKFWTDTMQEMAWHPRSVFEGGLYVLYLPAYLAGVVTITLVTANLMVLLRTRRE